MDQEGQVLRSGRVPNLRAEIEKFLEGGEAMEAVIETGRSSYTMVDVLEEMGVAVKIAHPNEVKAIARAKIKTDKRDSEVLAPLLRMNMVPEVYRRSKENRQAQRVLRQRSYYVSAMTALKNRVYAFLAQQREEIREVVARETNIFSEKGQKVLLRLELAPRAFDVSRAAGRGASVCACWAGGPSRRVRCWSDWPWSFRGGTRHR